MPAPGSTASEQDADARCPSRLLLSHKLHVKGVPERRPFYTKGLSGDEVHSTSSLAREMFSVKETVSPRACRAPHMCNMRHDETACSSRSSLMHAGVMSVSRHAFGGRHTDIPVPRGALRRPTKIVVPAHCETVLFSEGLCCLQPRIRIIG